MSNRIHPLISAALALTVCACSQDFAHEGETSKAIEHLKQDASKAADEIAESWAAMTHELDSMAGDIKAKIQASKPEVKARLHELQATFDENLALAKQKMAEAQAAAPEKAEALRREVRERCEAAKEAWSRIISH